MKTRRNRGQSLGQNRKKKEKTIGFLLSLPLQFYFFLYLGLLIHGIQEYFTAVTTGACSSLPLMAQQ